MVNTYLLFSIICAGFLMYSAIIQAWSRLKIGIKILLIVVVGPELAAFGLLDVIVLNLIFGSLLYLELPKQWTLSRRCCDHLYDANWRGRIAGAFSVPLNAILPGHIE